ncbi:MFS transporter [Streptomyces montanisoli]|uniref:MFS transporter n=1 Tax=Streptomyces montanisoli TaxID=2798581 RepID=A0A940MHP1_9ACTN|nr:MFS transporter [Streptomyces montanisoli]MBP0458778.1 MFS transporter [Streptomyces montanisoli]
MSTAPPATGRGNPNITLIAVCLAVLVLPASLTGASVALPDINADLHVSLAPLQWVVNAYNLAFACFMLVCGSLSDKLGRRRVFGVGTALFAAATLVSAVTSNIAVLDASRAVAGLGAAAVMTSGAAILATSFEGAAQGRAFAILGSSAGAGLALGPLTGGLLVNAFGWRAVFLSHLIVSVLVLIAVPLLPESRNPAATRVDWAGATTFTLSLFCLMLAVMRGPQQGWTSAEILLLLVGSAVLMALFAIVELRQEQPMFQLSLLRQGRFMAVSLIPVALSFGFVCLLVLLPTYFTGVVGMGTNSSGATMMLLTLPVLVVPLIVSKLVKHGVSTRLVLGLSLVVAAVGAAWLTVVDRDVSVGALAGPLLLLGIAMGMTAGLVDGVAITSVEPAQAGAAAGMFNTMRLAGEAFAIAVMSAVLLNSASGRIAEGLASLPGGAGRDAHHLADQAISGDVAGAAAGTTGAAHSGLLSLLTGSYTGALHTVLWTVTAICAASAVLVSVMLRDRKGAPTAEPAADQADQAGQAGQAGQAELGHEEAAV